MLFPVRKEDLNKCRYTSPYGPRWGRLHAGADIGMPVGTPLIALDNGKVIYSKLNGGGVTKGYGYYIVVQYDNGLYSLYGHLKELSKYRVGDRVNKGQIIAYSGNTGNTTGPHVHVEIHENEFMFRSQVARKGYDSAVDPVKYYPRLKGYLDKNLSTLVISEKEDDIVEFQHGWQKELLIKTIKNLKSKGVLNNADMWLDKAKNNTLTNAELSLLALVMADRD
ncbi:M23 family metallopeptidase [Dethiothermospora halolimnae]|uniref:M23 family metallopeptidase n=1 Tax=Dethiothermospora halolimnae TaxID=3114390 RepID=UPI003CCBC058